MKLDLLSIEISRMLMDIRITKLADVKLRSHGRFTYTRTLTDICSKSRPLEVLKKLVNVPMAGFADVNLCLLFDILGALNMGLIETSMCSILSESRLVDACSLRLILTFVLLCMCSICYTIFTYMELLLTIYKVTSFVFESQATEDAKLQSDKKFCSCRTFCSPDTFPLVLVIQGVRETCHSLCGCMQFAICSGSLEKESFLCEWENKSVPICSRLSYTRFKREMKSGATHNDVIVWKRNVHLYKVECWFYHNSIRLLRVRATFVVKNYVFKSSISTCGVHTTERSPYSSVIMSLCEPAAATSGIPVAKLGASERAQYDDVKWKVFYIVPLSFYNTGSFAGREVRPKLSRLTIYLFTPFLIVNSRTILSFTKVCLSVTLQNHIFTSGPRVRLRWCRPNFFVV